MPSFRWKPLLIGSALTLAAGSASMALFGAEKVADMLGLLGLLYKGLTLASAQNQLVNDFISRTGNCVVITNKTNAVWKFGYLASARSEVSGKQSGTVTLQTVSGDLKTWSDLGTLAPDAAAVTLPRNYGALVIKPVVAKTGLVTWEAFFRVCYLEDSRGQRISLNVTKDTPNSAVPVVGIAASSQRDVMRDTGTASKVLEIYQPAGIREKRLQGLDMIAIGVDAVR